MGQVPSGRAAHDDDLVGIYFVVGGAVAQPLSGLEHVIHGRGRRGCFRQPVFQVRHHHAVLHERHTILLDYALFLSLDPPAVDHDDTRAVLQGWRYGLQDIEDGLRIMIVADVGFDSIICAPG